MPYGEEIVGLGGRSSGQGYVADDVRQGFTGYENDDETGFDYAQARMYAKNIGRFTATDPVLMEPGRAFDPQRINLYSYVRNNPLVFVDPTGQIIDDSSLQEDEKYQKWKLGLLATKAGRALWDKYHNDKNFLLIINNDPSRDNGAITRDYKFQDGKLIGATISLGNDIGDRADAASRPEDQYPVTRALGKERVDTNLLGAAVLAHEFGHVEDAASRPDAFQAMQEYQVALSKRTKELGNHSAAYNSPDVAALRTKSFDKFGVKDIDALAIQTDNRAEKTAIPVIQQSFANRSNRVPKSIRKAIDKLNNKP